MLRALHPPRRIPKMGRDSPQRYKQPIPLRQPIIARGRLPTLRAPTAHAAMRLQADFDRPRLPPVTLQPNFLVHKSGKVLYSVQNRLNLELNSWSPRSINCFLVNRRLIEPLEISYFVFLVEPTRPPSELWEKCEIPLLPRDFQVEWESPFFGLFHAAAFSIAQLPTNSAIEP
jgi:hypothetical protein